MTTGLFKEYTKEELDAWDALITERYSSLLDDAALLIDHTMEAYKKSESDEDYAMMMEALEHQSRIIEDLGAREVRKAEQSNRNKQVFQDFLDDVERKIAVAKQAAATEALAAAIKRIDETVTQMRHQGQRRRVGFTPQAKATLIKATAAMGGNCPCCEAHPVVRNGERIGGAEFDHFFANHIARADAGWLICQKCHRSLTHNAGLRTEKAQAFSVFQAHRKQAETHPMMGLSG